MEDASHSWSGPSPPLPPPLHEALGRQGIASLFPLQRSLLRASRDRDICLCAPTGSGKTLAYALPMLVHISRRRLVRLRALIVVPGRELAVQVASVLEPLASSLDLRVALAIGQTSMTNEARRLVCSASVGGPDSDKVGHPTRVGEAKELRTLTMAVDILVATPGRLLDHMESTRGFTLEHVEYLILDEADRLLDGFTRDWLPTVLTAITRPTLRTADDPLRTYRHHGIGFDEAVAPGFAWVTPLRKILSSATLTRNPAKLVELHLHHPLTITHGGDGMADGGDKTVGRDMNDRDDTTGHGSGSEGGLVPRSTPDPATRSVPFQGGYSMPKGLEEFMHVCEETRKPVAVIYLLEEARLGGPSLCFTRSVEATKRLALLLTRACPHRHIAAYSAELSSETRAGLLERFANGALDLLVCSDAAARGLDLPGVAAVINYDAPRHLRTYVHRVGRTARAGRSGRAYTILAIHEAHHFKQMVAKRHQQGERLDAAGAIEKDSFTADPATGSSHAKRLMASLRIPKASLQRIVPLVEQSLEQQQ